VLYNRTLAVDRRARERSRVRWGCKAEAGGKLEAPAATLKPQQASSLSCSYRPHAPVSSGHAQRSPCAISRDPALFFRLHHTHQGKAQATSPCSPRRNTASLRDPPNRNARPMISPTRGTASFARLQWRLASSSARPAAARKPSSFTKRQPPPEYKPYAAPPHLYINRERRRFRN
jgi:hypothetical protein